MQLLVRAVLYIWLLIGFSVTWSLLFDFDKLGAVTFLLIWVGGALLLGWIGDAILFGKGTIFGRNNFKKSAKIIYVSFITLIPIAAMVADVFRA